MTTSNPVTLVDRAALRFASDSAALERALADVTFHVPPQNQGQIVEVAYGSDCAGLVFRRTVDRSDGSTSYAVADSADCGCDSGCSCFEPWNSEPLGFDWVSIEEPPEPVEYTFSIFDANPNMSGTGAWPDYDRAEVGEEYCGSPQEALDYALDVAKTEGEACGEYAAGDRLWVIVYGPAQNYTGSVVLEASEEEDADEDDDGDDE